MNERLDHDPQVAAVLARLADVKSVSDHHWLARCPVNGEHRLRVFTVEGQEPYVSCVDGCDDADVLAKLGLDGRDDASPSTDELLGSIEAFIRRYVVVHDEAAVAISLFVAHSHAFAAAHATPYLALLSPERRSGKTLLLEVLELLVARPWRLSSTSEAALFRKIAQDRPTLLLDEIDTVFTATTERAEGLRAILNAGNRPGSTVARCVGKGSEQSVEDFEVFGPKVLAGIDTGRLPDTIRDRAIELRMMRKTPAEPVQKFRRRHVEPGAERLRDQAAAWAVEREVSLLDADPEVPEALNDRAQDAWEPLLAIADLAGGEWPTRARAAAVALAAGEDHDELAHGPRILRALRDLLGNAKIVTTAHLLDRLNHDEELPYGAWSDGRGIGAQEVAKRLRPYGVRPGSVRLADGSTPKGYRRGNPAVEDAFARYLAADHPPHATNVACGTPRHSRDVADVADVAANPGKGESEGPGAPDEALATAGEEVEAERLGVKFGRGPEHLNGDDPLADLAPETPLPNPAVDARPAPGCRCDRPVRGTDEDGDPQCAGCGRGLGSA